MSAAMRALLREIVDYAGLFPPAGLKMGRAVAEYARHRADADAWILGRFVLPAPRLGEWQREVTPFLGDEQDRRPWRLAVLGSVADSTAVAATTASVNAAQGGRALVDTLELKAATVEEIAAAPALASLGMQIYVEMPAADDPAPFVAAVARAGLRAKIRTGGVTADAFPTVESVARFIRCCVDLGVPFKATAGLHHPLRAEFRMTYENDAPRATMLGFLNVFLAAAIARAGGSDGDVNAVLEERDPAALRVTPDRIRWRAWSFDEDALRATRALATSFGSCSFREPVDDLKALGLL